MNWTKKVRQKEKVLKIIYIDLYYIKNAESENPAKVPLILVIGFNSTLFLFDESKLSIVYKLIFPLL